MDVVAVVFMTLGAFAIGMGVASLGWSCFADRKILVKAEQDEMDYLLPWIALNTVWIRSSRPYAIVTTVLGILLLLVGVLLFIFPLSLNKG